jgi:hypothetical protein
MLKNEIVSPQYRPRLLSLSASGVTGVQEETEITCVADVEGSLNDKYFLYNTPSQGYYVWINVDGDGTDPEVDGRVGIEVEIDEDDSNSAVAAAVAAAMDAVNGISASAASQVVTAVNDEDGVVDAAADSGGGTATGFTISQEVAGVDSGVALGFGKFDASIAESGAGPGDYTITFNEPFVRVPQIAVLPKESVVARIVDVTVDSVQIEFNDLSGDPTDTDFDVLILGSQASHAI